MVHKCSELFGLPCWWRNKYINCCSIFTEQKSEYGICYAFNSATNPVGYSKLVSDIGEDNTIIKLTAAETAFSLQMNEPTYPWRTSSYGDWSGLRMEVNINDSTKIKGIKSRSGILVNICNNFTIRKPLHIWLIRFQLMVHHPMQWPDNKYFIPAGAYTNVVIKPSFSYATRDVNRLAVCDRNCLFPEEVARLKVQTLPGLKYMRPNCIAACRQSYMLSLCNCTVDFLYPESNYEKCNASSFKCLYEYFGELRRRILLFFNLIFNTRLIFRCI